MLIPMSVNSRKDNSHSANVKALFIALRLDRRDIGAVVAFDLVDDCLELDFFNLINKVTNKAIKYVNMNV